MLVEFEKSKHERLVNDYAALSKKYDKRGEKVSDDILAAIGILRDAPTLSEVPPAFHPHPLDGVYKGCFAIWVNKKYRVIFKPSQKNDLNYRIDNPKTINSVLVVEIFINYHDK